MSCWLDLRTNEELKVKIVWGDNEEEIVESYVAKNILNIDKSHVYYGIDEEGYEIKNKFGYLKNSIYSNINKIIQISNSRGLFDPDEYDWLNDDEEDYEL